jgi:uncharacterized OsmC-like protein
MLDTVKNQVVNGLDLTALAAEVDLIEADSSKGIAEFNVTSRWAGACRSEATVDGFTLGGERFTRSHKIVADEPVELLGEDSAPNPQELLMAAFNACIMVGYVAGASLKGINLESVEIRTRGQLDLRGFLGLSDKVAPGYEALDYEVFIKGDGTPEDFAEIHKTVMATSPNYFNMSRPIRMNGSLKLG